MGDMFRSEEMVLCQMFLQPEAAYASVAAVGERGCVQFRDLNSEINAFQRKFVSEVRRCDELERRIRYIETELQKDVIPLPLLDEGNEPPTPNPREIIDLEAKLECIETELRELSLNSVSLETNYVEMIELKGVLHHAGDFFSDEEILNLDSNRYVDPDSEQGQGRGQLSFIAGVIKLEKFFSFERMMWRVGHGNIFIKRSDLSDMVKDPQTGLSAVKTVFVAFFQGDQLKQRIKKICQAFHASMYPCPSAHNEREAMLKDVCVRIEDLKVVLKSTEDHRFRVLTAAASNVPTWGTMIRKMKAIYHTLNMCNMDVSNKCLIGEGWVPAQDVLAVQNALALGSSSAESTIPSFMNIINSNEQPPTFMRTNKFTAGFQNLIDAYGVASYREVNPALYTIIIFPFLFAVMFGDLGHGFILLLCALYMVVKEEQLKKVKGEIFNIFFGGRYIILLMALFSMYTGLIYNDIFSISMNLFGSKWRVHYNASTVTSNPFLQLNPKYHADGIYPFGMDPIWQLAKNKIIFLNTFKMKLSIIFGVIHMIFGVLMSLVNYLYFKKTLNIVMDFIPQILFLILLFGYMAFMMFFKFVQYSGQADQQELMPGCAPSILILFINMMLFKHQKPLEGCKEYMFEGQEVLQLVFVILALLCIPWMLFGKPLYYMYKRRQATTAFMNTNGNIGSNASLTPESHGSQDEANEPMEEIFIQQAIHAIEYVLSTISHTASYLRLWALSLAHSQLSEVLWTKVLHLGFFLPGFFSIPLLFIAFVFWAFLTVAILVLIEGLSAFLHTLRLHWVEFMSKFYEGAGYAFQPFSFKAIFYDRENE